MNKKNILIVLTLAISVSGLGFFFSESFSKREPISAQDAVKNYLIDQNRRIGVEETSIAIGLNLPSKTGEQSSNQAPSNSDENAEGLIANDQSGGLPEHNLADYFRYLQTNIGEGRSPSEHTEAIQEHLLSTLSPETAGELIDLYEKFTNFERDAVTRAEEWDMPESADETLGLIGNMQAYQQEYFGPEMADSLFGAEMKVMEYNARRAIIINDSQVSASEKERLLDQLGAGMWGEEAYREMNKNKDPYDILDEKLLVYGHELAALDPDTRKQEIQNMRDEILPKGY